MFLLCKVLLELEAFKRTDARLARSHSEGITNQSSLFLFVKLINAKDQNKLFCRYFSEKGECRKRSVKSGKSEEKIRVCFETFMPTP
jgi:hypothetical protein